jgi:hypothetical protein
LPKGFEGLPERYLNPSEDRTLTQPNVTPPTNLGFLTVLHETNGYLGGYLVTNQWGRPLEFRLSTAVQPNRVQQILYGGTLQPYLCADLIGKTLVDKTAAPVQLVLTDTEAVLDLRLRLEFPVAWLVTPTSPRFASLADNDPGLCAHRPGQGKVLCHPRYLGDAGPLREILERLDIALELGEPFARIREAIAEARKMGVTGRSA